MPEPVVIAAVDAGAERGPFGTCADATPAAMASVLNSSVRRMLSQEGGAESYYSEPISDHHGRRARIILWPEGGLDDALGAADEPRWNQHVSQKLDGLAADGSVNRPSLTRGTGRVVVGVVPLRARRLDMRRHPPVSPFGERSHGNNELGSHRQEGDDAEQPAARSRCDRAKGRHSFKVTAECFETLAQPITRWTITPRQRHVGLGHELSASVYEVVEVISGWNTELRCEHFGIRCDLVIKDARPRGAARRRSRGEWRQLQREMMRQSDAMKRRRDHAIARGAEAIVRVDDAIDQAQ